VGARAIHGSRCPRSVAREESLGYTTVLKLLQIMTAKGTCAERKSNGRTFMRHASRDRNEAATRRTVLQRVLRLGKRINDPCAGGPANVQEELGELRRLLDEYEGRTR